jgi:GNAT superfamily N-acetyltransferase
MSIDVRQEAVTALPDYARIPIAFDVEDVLDVAINPDSDGSWPLASRRLDVPYRKDYDAHPGETPVDWALRFDLSHWGLFLARISGRTVGGAAVTAAAPDVIMLEGRRDLALLWDIRVVPEARGQGVGSLLFQAAERWARERGCRQLKVETQNINVPACRFYARRGCSLRAVSHGAYEGLPDEVQLLWYKDLVAQPGG